MSPEEVREEESKDREMISAALSEESYSKNSNQEIPSSALRYPAEEIGGRLSAPGEHSNVGGRLMPTTTTTTTTTT
jgi:hypothetical protein